jgi:hypothetical protein
MHANSGYSNLADCRFSAGLCGMALAPVTLRQVLTAALRYCRTRASVLLRRLRGTGPRLLTAREA